MDRTGYAYIKGSSLYKFYYDGYYDNSDEDDEFYEIEKVFDTLEDLLSFVITISDQYGFKIQFFNINERGDLND